MVKLLGDDPVDGTPEFPDLLSRERYAKEIANLLWRVRKDSNSSVLALVGPWGSGKTSVLEMVERELRSSANEGRWLTANFNPWMYNSVAALQIAFFGELHAALPKDEQWKTAKDRLGELGKKLAPLASLIPGIDASRAIDFVADTLAGDTGIAETKRRAEEALRCAKSPMLVVVDDLDRLTPDELLFVFKLIRLVGRLPNIYYLLSFDERTMLDVLSRTELVGGTGTNSTPNRARDYLEKIVQIRLDLPIFGEYQVLEMVNRALGFVIESSGVALDESDLERFQTAFSRHLQERLNTPRAINRYFGQVDALYGLIGKEVDFVDFMLVTWLRTTEPLAYQMLSRHKDELTGTSGKLYVNSKQQTHAQVVEIWKTRLRESDVAENHVDGVLAVLAVLFVPVKSATDGMDYGEKWAKEIGERRGVGSADYFDRYFSFGVPEGDVADLQVEAALAALSVGEMDAPEVLFLRSALTNETGLVCRKIASLVQGNPVAPAEAILTLMAECYSKIPIGGGQAQLSSRRTIDLFAADLLPRLAAATVPVLLPRLAHVPEGIYLVANIVARASVDARSRPDHAPILTWISEAQYIVSGLIQERLNVVHRVRLELISAEDWQLVWTWHHIDHARWTVWYRNQLADGWSLIDLVAKLVQEEWHSGNPSRHLLDMATVDSLLGLEYVLEVLGEELLPAQGPFTLPASIESWQDRQIVAKELLRQQVVAQRRPASGA